MRRGLRRSAVLGGAVLVRRSSVRRGARGWSAELLRRPAVGGGCVPGRRAMWRAIRRRPALLSVRSSRGKPARVGGDRAAEWVHALLRYRRHEGRRLGGSRRCTVRHTMRRHGARNTTHRRAPRMPRPETPGNRRSRSPRRRKSAVLRWSTRHGSHPGWRNGDGSGSAADSGRHWGNAHHRPLQFARHRRLRARRAGTRCARKPRSSGRTWHRRSRSPGGPAASRRLRYSGDLRLIHHQHRSLELRGGSTLEMKIALRAGLSRIRVLRATVRTEHSAPPSGYGVGPRS
jgi:hypothetical protein